jgi:hypothetical protein
MAAVLSCPFRLAARKHNQKGKPRGGEKRQEQDGRCGEHALMPDTVPSCVESAPSTRLDHVVDNHLGTYGVRTAVRFPQPVVASQGIPRARHELPIGHRPWAPHGQGGNARQMEQVMWDRLTCVLSAHPRGAPALRERKRAPRSGRAGALTDRHASERASSSMSVAFNASLCSRKRPTTGAGRPCCPRARWAPSAAGRPREPGICAPSSLACGSSGRPKRAPAPILAARL